MYKALDSSLSVYLNCEHISTTDKYFIEMSTPSIKQKTPSIKQKTHIQNFMVCEVYDKVNKSDIDSG